MAGRIIAAAAILSAVGWSSPAGARSAESRQTRDFVQAAAQADQFEILEARSALAESRDPRIRAFAQEMIQAHQRTRDSLYQAVAKNGLEEPAPGVSSDQSMLLASLQSQRGTDFDKIYVRHQVLAHHAALAVEQAYAASGDIGDMRQCAATNVAIISAHLQMAEQMGPSFGAT